MGSIIHKLMDLRKTGHAAQAIVVGEAALRENPELENDPRFMNQMGLCYQCEQDYLKAEACYGKVIRLDPDFNPVHKGYAFMALFRHDLDKAQARFAEAMQRMPGDYFSAFTHARVALMRHDYDAANERLERIDEQFPDKPYAICALASVAAHLGDSKLALERYRQATQRFPDDIVPYSGMAQVLLQEGQLEKAESIIREGIARNPATPHFYTQLYVIGLKQDKPAQREKYLIEATDGLFERCPPKLHNMQVLKIVIESMEPGSGLHHRMQQRFNAGLAYLESAGELTPSELAPLREPDEPLSRNILIHRLLGFNNSNRVFGGIYDLAVSNSAAQGIWGMYHRRDGSVISLGQS